MIAKVQYTCIGSEVITGGNTEIYFHPASGLKIIDTIVKGYSKPLTVDEETGLVTVDEVLVKGDTVVVLYKTLPRFGAAALTDFDLADFESTDFA